MCRHSSDRYSLVSFLWRWMKPVGQTITGVQKTIFLSLTAALLSFRPMREAADAMEPVSKLLVSLITESSLLLAAWLEAGDLALRAPYLDAIYH